MGDAPTAAQEAVAKILDRACRDHGFVAVTNFGLTPALRRNALSASKALFAQSDAAKSRMSPISPQTNMGYAAYGAEKLNRSRPADLKEAFNVRSPHVHTNDFRGCPPEFADVSLELWAVIEKAARRFAIAQALALGLDLDYFSKALCTMDCAYSGASLASNRASLISAWLLWRTPPLRFGDCRAPRQSVWSTPLRIARVRVP